MNPINLIIADDHPIFRQGLRQVIESAPDLHIVAEASEGATAWAHLDTLRPQVAVLDVEMPEQDGFALAQRVRAERLPVGLIFLTMYKKERFINAAFDLGVKGYVLKDSAAAEIIDCIRAVAAGKHFISPVLANHLINRTRRAIELLHEEPGIGALTATERRVLKLLAEGKTSKQIAEELLVSFRTIEHHRANIAAKLDLKGSNALLQFAIRFQAELS